MQVEISSEETAYCLLKLSKIKATSHITCLVESGATTVPTSRLLCSWVVLFGVTASSSSLFRVSDVSGRFSFACPMACLFRWIRISPPCNFNGNTQQSGMATGRVRLDLDCPKPDPNELSLGRNLNPTRANTRNHIRSNPIKPQPNSPQ